MTKTLRSICTPLRDRREHAPRPSFFLERGPDARGTTAGISPLHPAPEFAPAEERELSVTCGFAPLLSRARSSAAMSSKLCGLQGPGDLVSAQYDARRHGLRADELEGAWRRSQKRSPRPIAPDRRPVRLLPRGRPSSIEVSVQLPGRIRSGAACDSGCAPRCRR